MQSSPARMLLAPEIHAVVGREINVYFDTIVVDPNPYTESFEVHADIGIQLERRWCFTPTEREIGDHRIRVVLRDADYRVAASAEARVHVAPATAGAGRQLDWLLIGDSITHASFYPEHLLALCAGSANPRLRLVGTHGIAGFSAGNRHEGYGGWTAERFTSLYLPLDAPDPPHRRTSPFVFAGPDGVPRLDVRRYIDEHAGGVGPDVVTIMLGSNEIARADEQGISSALETWALNVDLLVAAFHELRSSTDVGIVTPQPPAPSQDAFGSNYGCAISRRQYRRNLHRLVDRLLARYGGRTGEHVHVVPVYINFDASAAYPTEAVPVHANSTQLVRRTTNALHPTPEGHRQIADSMFFWMKSLVEEEKR